MDTDLLVNPKMGGMADLETIDIPTLNFDELPAPEAPAPRLVASFEETGPIKLDGLENFNAEPYAPVAPKRMSEEAIHHRQPFGRDEDGTRFHSS